MSSEPKKHRAMLVSFSGIDGTGKSTQIANLRTNLTAVGLKVQLITFWDDVARLKPIREGLAHNLFRGDKGVGTPQAPINRRDKNIRSPFMSLFRMMIYVVDALSLRGMAKKAQKSEADVVIFDRYIYDELANLNLESRFTQIYLRGMMKLVPRPEYSFVLDANPVEARARKPEYPLEFLHSNRNAYLKLSQLLGGMTVIPSRSIDEVGEQIMQCLEGASVPGLAERGGTKDDRNTNLSGAET